MTAGALVASDLAPGLLLGDGVTIGDGVTFGGHAIVHAGVEIGVDALVGDHAQIRDGARVGAGSTVGSFASIDPGVVIGVRVSLQTRCYLAAGSILEDDVFLGPGVTLTNDNSMGRHAIGEALHGSVLRRACRIGAGAVICPGVEIGEEAYVAAGAVVIDDVDPRTVVAGVPARPLREVPGADLLERWR